MGTNDAEDGHEDQVELLENCLSLALVGLKLALLESFVVETQTDGISVADDRRLSFERGRVRRRALVLFMQVEAGLGERALGARVLKRVFGVER